MAVIGAAGDQLRIPRRPVIKAPTIPVRARGIALR
jgi:hypothetical protein